MEAIKDINGRLVCYGDALRGVIESVYRKESISVVLPVGGAIVFNRGDVRTSISRHSESQFYIYSRRLTG